MFRKQNIKNLKSPQRRIIERTKIRERIMKNKKNNQLSQHNLKALTRILRKRNLWSGEWVFGRNACERACRPAETCRTPVCGSVLSRKEQRRTRCVLWACAHEQSARPGDRSRRGWTEARVVNAPLMREARRCKLEYTALGSRAQAKKVLPWHGKTRSDSRRRAEVTGMALATTCHWRISTFKDIPQNNQKIIASERGNKLSPT